MLMGMKNNAVGGFDMYCRIEGMDCRYLLSDLHRNTMKKGTQKTKKAINLPSIHMIRPNI
jgi:hypothetical protein